MDKAIVTTDVGNHTMDVPRGMGEVVSELLQMAGISGQFTLRLKEKIKGRSATKGVFVQRRFDASSGIELKVQPGGNDTRHVCHLFMPKEHRKEFNKIFRKLSKLAIEQRKMIDKPRPKKDEPKVEDVFQVLPQEVPEKIVQIETSKVEDEQYKPIHERLVGKKLFQLITEFDIIENEKGYVLNSDAKVIFENNNLQYTYNYVLLYLVESGLLLKTHISPKKPKYNLRKKAKSVLRALSDNPDQTTDATLRKIEFFERRIRHIEADAYDIVIMVNSLKEELKKIKEEIEVLIS